MKDIVTCPPSSLMGKVGVLKKDKTSTKKVKETKTLTKNSIKGKIPRISIKKSKNKSKDGKNKSLEKKKNPGRKKNENKKDPKKKAVKEAKFEKKTLKNTLLDVGKKRKLSQKNHIIKSNGDHAPPVKIQKIIPSSCDSNRLINGNANVVPQTTRNPWVLKLDLSPQRPNTVPNGVSNSRGTLALCNKSVIFIPKRNAVSGMILKRGPSISYLKKDEATNALDKNITNTKSSTCKPPTTVNKETSKKLDSYPDLLQGLEKTKKNDPKSSPILKDQKSVSNKDSKSLCNMSTEQKSFNLKESKLASEDKTLSKDQSVLNVKDQKLMSRESKQSNLKQEKSFNNKIVTSVSSKESKMGSAKIQKAPGKETKPSNNKFKKPCPKEEKTICVREPTKIHPQRMASLDAMAKMHVICSTDRRASFDTLRIADSTKDHVEPNLQRKAVLESSKRIQIGFKKETQEFNGHVIRSRINCVKVEESSVSERRDIRTFSSISHSDDETATRRPRGRPRLKPTSESPEPEPSPSSIPVKRQNAKSLAKGFKPKKTPIKKDDKKVCKGQKESVLEKAGKKTKRKEAESKSNKKQPCKLENTKSKVKVKETIRMRKTCTYQSVTTVSSHEAVNSVVESCSRLGVTTNYETKKTVVTGEACEKKTDLRLEEMHQGPFMPAIDGQCSTPNVSNCCRHVMHPVPQTMIPFAHSQSCHGFQGARNSNSSPQHHCDCSFGMHRCSHQQQHLMYPRPSHDCSCCCSGSLIQSMHDACLLSKEANSCAHHPPPPPHCRVNSPVFSPCSPCHASAEGRRHHEQHHFNMPPASGFLNRWCGYYEPCHDSRHHQPASCAQCSVASAKTTAPLVPCDQSPLDLSLAAGTSQPIGNTNEQSRTHCPNHHCCQDVPHFQSSPPRSSCQHCNSNYGFSGGNCNSCRNRYTDFSVVDKSQHPQRPSDKMHCGLLLVQPKPTPEPCLSSLASKSSIGDGPSSNVIHRELSSSHNCTYSSTKQERNNSLHGRLQISKKRKFAHGWSWEGEPAERLIALTNDSVPTPKRCYPAMRHREGDIIKERDCVLLKSGPKDTDLPYVAKVAAFWENLDDGEMMMSLLWYYRPEHTEQGRKSGQMEDEVFASKHRDVNSVACIEDKCYVLTFNEYCRYRANLAMVDVTSLSPAGHSVPEPGGGYPRQNRLPTEYVSPEMIFFCRHVYDFRQKRILKNPT